MNTNILQKKCLRVKQLLENAYYKKKKILSWHHILDEYIVPGDMANNKKVSRINNKITTTDITYVHL
jgi:hypothetical protein